MGGRRRPVVAAVLALAVTGLGHAYLRRWSRAIAWLLAIATAAVVLMGTFVDSNVTNVWELPLTVLGPLAGLSVLSAIDAYRLATRAGTPDASERGGAEGVPAEGESVQCPNCGREVDPELDFCHWCTQPLSFDAESGGSPDPHGGNRD